MHFIHKTKIYGLFAYDFDFLLDNKANNVSISCQTIYHSFMFQFLERGRPFFGW